MSEVARAVPAEHDAHHEAQTDPPESAGRIAELRVSGNLMNLDAGLFCVFQVPGSTPPDPLTGLPGVRVSLAPGMAGRPDAVSISTFRHDGWLDGTGALVKVKEGPAQILVTIYQSGQKSLETAPHLQVLRLSGDPVAAPDPQVQAATQPSAPVETPEVVAHVQRTGDVGGGFGDWIGVRGSGLWMEGFSLAPRQPLDAEDFEYQGVLGRGWLSPWVEGGKFCGSRGMALPLLGFKLRLKGEAAKTYTCSYSATFIDGSAVGPLPAGESCESDSMAALESLHIELRLRDSRPARTARPKTATRTARK